MMENFDTTKSVKAINIIKEESQFDRIEKKMDRILELLESKDSSISVTLNADYIKLR